MKVPLKAGLLEKAASVLLEPGGKIFHILWDSDSLTFCDREQADIDRHNREG